MSAGSRFLIVGEYIYAAHVKNFVIRHDFPLRTMEPNWQDRAMQFTDPQRSRCRST